MFEENWILLGNRDSTNNRNDITTFQKRHGYSRGIYRGGRRRVVKNNANFTPECRGSLHYYQDREGKNVSQRWQTRLNSCFRDTSTFLLTHVKIPVYVFLNPTILCTSNSLFYVLLLLLFFFFLYFL